MTISLVDDGDAQYPSKSNPPTQTWEGILGRGRVALSSGDGTDLTDTGGALDVNISASDVDLSSVGLQIENALDFTAFDLNAAAFSETTSQSLDYILDNIKLNFSTTESKTITITGPDGTILYKDTNTAKNVIISEMDMGFNANENFTVDVTVFSSAGTMDCLLKIKEGSSTLGGSPVLGAGDEVIGRVKISDGTDVLDVLADGDVIDLQDPDGTVGTTKSILTVGKDQSKRSRPFGIWGEDNDSSKVVGEQEHLLKEILVELKINNKILNEVHDLYVGEEDIERK